MEKEKAILVYVDLRTLWDTYTQKDAHDFYNTFLDFINNIKALGQRAGGAKTILSIITDVNYPGVDRYAGDFTWENHITGALSDACMIETMGQKDARGMINYETNPFGLVGKVLLNRWQLDIDRSNGAGAWEKVCHYDPTPLLGKTVSYVSELEERYFIDKIVLISDNPQAVTQEELAKQTGKRVIWLQPAMPWCESWHKDENLDPDTSCRITDDHYFCLFLAEAKGVNLCFKAYLKSLEEEIDTTRK